MLRLTNFLYNGTKILKPSPRLLLATLLTSAIITACDSDGTVIDFENGGAPTLSDKTVPGASNASTTALLNYTMPDINGGNRRENAVVMIPQGDTPEGGWPVLGWGHGTVGVADACAPSATDNLSGYDVYLNRWLAAGYAIVAPDYEGIGTTGGHPYLHLDSEGRSINYAVAAATEAFEQLSSRYAVLGHSQGGHAVLGAASLSDENAEITLVGAVAIAPASQVLAQGTVIETLYTNPEASDAERVAAAVSDLGFSAFLAHGVKTVFPEFDLDTYYGADGQTLQQGTETTCLPQISADLATTVPPILLSQNNVESILSPQIEQDQTVLAYLQSVEPGNRVLGAPLMIAQGVSDLTVLPDSTIALNDQLAAVSNTDIDPVFSTYIGANHISVLEASFTDAATFLAGRFAAE